MGPRTAEPLAGAGAWALARWATLRGAQPVRPKQADPITVGQDRSVCSPTLLFAKDPVAMATKRALYEHLIPHLNIPGYLW
ncbi:hypothetical protein EYF80_038864 [Liparis tanakae]|uniref:Uncharacterized protein n=1 Tax=Liparis tanakae TaxID=230148 RepID=A0A4Z2GCG4_9TELE|nr:hypothetical protein EYF80_038864 [Liparis tanakae]